jgi:hypothetical protein
MLYRVHLAWAGLKLIMLLVIGTDCIGSCKSNYHTNMTTTAPQQISDITTVQFYMYNVYLFSISSETWKLLISTDWIQITLVLIKTHLCVDDSGEILKPYRKNVHIPYINAKRWFFHGIKVNCSHSRHKISKTFLNYWFRYLLMYSLIHF